MHRRKGHCKDCYLRIAQQKRHKLASKEPPSLRTFVEAQRAKLCQRHRCVHIIEVAVALGEALPSTSQG